MNTERKDVNEMTEDEYYDWLANQYANAAAARSDAMENSWNWQGDWY